MSPWIIALVSGAVLIAALAAVLGFKSTKYVAAWEVVGGLAIALAWVEVLASRVAGSISLVTVVTSLAVMALALTAGVLLWRGSPVGFKLSLLAQALQVAWVSLPFVQFGSTLGPLLGVRLRATALTFTMGFYGRGGISFGSRLPLDITLNLFGVFALIALWRQRADFARDAAA